MQFTVYILFSQVKDRYYIGHAEDLEKRIMQHNMRKNLGASDWIVVYKEYFTTRG